MRLSSPRDDLTKISTPRVWIFFYCIVTPARLAPCIASAPAAKRLFAGTFFRVPHFQHRVPVPRCAVRVRKSPARVRKNLSRPCADRVPPALPSGRDARNIFGRASANRRVRLGHGVRGGACPSAGVRVQLGAVGKASVSADEGYFLCSALRLMRSWRARKAESASGDGADEADGACGV